MFEWQSAETNGGASAKRNKISKRSIFVEGFENVMMWEVRLR